MRLAASSSRGLGLLVVIALVAETGSGLYILDSIFPGRTSLRTLYMLGMTCSNSLAIWGAAEFAENSLVDLGIRVSYAVVVGLLVILRTAGQVLELRKWRAAPSKALDSISTRCRDGDEAGVTKYLRVMEGENHEHRVKLFS